VDCLTIKADRGRYGLVAVAPINKGEISKNLTVMCNLEALSDFLLLNFVCAFREN